MRLIDEVEADAIIIATPAASHVEICVRALARNLCVLLEKPVAPSVAAAAPLLQSARSSSGFVLPGHVLRFSRDHERLVEIVRSGRIGEVIYVNSRRYRDDSHAVRYPDTDPVLMTLIHDIDLAHWVDGFRLPHGSRPSVGGPRLPLDDGDHGDHRDGSDLRLAHRLDFRGRRLAPDRLEAVGDRGSVELTVGEALQVYAEGRCTAYPPAEADDPLRNEHEHFLACVRDRSRAPALDLADALAGLKLADAAIEVSQPEPGGHPRRMRFARRLGTVSRSEHAASRSGAYVSWIATLRSR